VFVVPSNAPDSAPVFVSSSAQSEFLAYGMASTLNASNVVTGYWPATYMYLATDADGNLHVYGLDLTSITAPAPVQISNLSLPVGTAPLNEVICDWQAAFTNVLQPQTLFVLLHLPGPYGCIRGGNKWQVVHYTDSPTTAPYMTQLFSSAFTPLYAPSGALSGLIEFDPIDLILLDYADDTFTTGVQAIASGDIMAVTTLYSSSLDDGQAFTGTTLFLEVTTNGNGPMYGTNMVYRLPYSSNTATLLYNASGYVSGVVNDDNNLYFSDVANGTSATTQEIWQVPLAGGTPIQLFGYTVPANTGPYSLIGSNNASLVVWSAVTDPASQLLTDTLGTLTVGVGNLSVQPLGQALNGTVTAFLLPATAGARASDLLYASADNPVAGGAYTFASEVLGLDGSSKQALTANTYFLDNATSPLSGAVLQLTGINATGGGMGGGQIQAVNVSSLAATPLTAAGGGSYTLAGGDTPDLMGVAPQLGAGTAVPSSSSAASIGLLLNLATDSIVPISIDNTNVTLF
jgi:hypothetical protein